MYHLACPYRFAYTLALRHHRPCSSFVCRLASFIRSLEDILGCQSSSILSVFHTTSQSDPPSPSPFEGSEATDVSCLPTLPLNTLLRVARTSASSGHFEKRLPPRTTSVPDSGNIRRDASVKSQSARDEPSLPLDIVSEPNHCTSRWLHNRRSEIRSHGGVDICTSQNVACATALAT
ncbi:hypothetical protein AUEXF2481DRAFT_639760 [Aureobasidium subglaciale EXF-2481]|uniref:Uncharacterized protein n=1 Tax=Aureobasidium subglaciale (strain EXF-2481) TaxID=1043005 RepID=A0A074YK56_AURSE|nr:uncharacterized protein AUEXF2481DRAFT_639760 [Aureobasidium subglaciale EXF-2481]KEQ96459.1 hypothetical protein AUEXF2481DRAFT_639760 [Aureobasidium subglaciale EXF-2481]